MRSLSLSGGLLPVSGGHPGPVASMSTRPNRSHEPARSNDHSGDGRSVPTRGVADDIHVVGGSRIVAGRGRCILVRSPCEVVYGLLPVGSRLWREQAVRLRPEELSPGRPAAPRCRAEAASAKHRGDRRGRDVDAELQELPSDPEVAPPRVLLAQSKDQALDRGIERRTAGPPGAASAPSPQELPVPPKEGVRPHQEAPPPVPGEQLGGRG